MDLLLRWSSSICLPRDPERGIFKDKTDGHKTIVFGKEYETPTLWNLLDHYVPCAVCTFQNRSFVKMFRGEADNS